MKFIIIALCLLLLAVVLFPVFATAKTGGRIPCLSHLKQMTVSLLMYASDNDERLPLRDSWMDAAVATGLKESALHCPQLKDPTLYGYCFQAKLSGAKLPAQPEDVELIFESINLARNASGTLESLPNPPRHRTGNYIAFADGHARFRKTP